MEKLLGLKGLKSNKLSFAPRTVTRSLEWSKLESCYGQCSIRNLCFVHCRSLANNSIRFLTRHSFRGLRNLRELYVSLVSFLSLRTTIPPLDMRLCGLKSAPHIYPKPELYLSFFLSVSSLDETTSSIGQNSVKLRASCSRFKRHP